MIKWRRAALQYPCETCGAAPGAKCVRISGALSYEIHTYRTTLARAGGWKVFEDDD